MNLVDVTVVIVNKLTLRQMWSLVTSIGKGDKSCDFNDQTERGYFQWTPVLDKMLICLN